jgi:hypothetical protein
MAAPVHRKEIAVQPRLEGAVDGFQEVVAVILEVEGEQIVAEQPVEDLVLPGADAKCLRVGPGDVPELADHRILARGLHHAGQQRVVIVLHEHDRLGAGNLLEHRVGEPAVDGDVLAPVGRVEHGTRIRDMAQGPECAVGEAVVIPFLFAVRQPDAAQGVGRLVGRHGDPALGVGCVAIAGAASVCDPRAPGRAHHRVERGDQPTGRLHPRQPRAGLLPADPRQEPGRLHLLQVDVGFAVCHDDEPRIAQPRGDVGGERRGRHTCASAAAASARSRRAVATSAVDSSR